MPIGAAHADEVADAREKIQNRDYAYLEISRYILTRSLSRIRIEMCIAFATKVKSSNIECTKRGMLNGNTTNIAVVAALSCRAVFAFQHNSILNTGSIGAGLFSV